MWCTLGGTSTLGGTPEVFQGVRGRLTEAKLWLVQRCNNVVNCVVHEGEHVFL